MIFGCVAAAVLALAVDQLLALIETGIRLRSRIRTAIGVLGIAALVIVTLAPSFARSGTRIVVGAKTFTEQYVLAALMSQRLQAAGLPATTRQGLGSSVIYDALASGDIDVYIDYSGTLWANQFHRTRDPAARTTADRAEDDACQAGHHAVSASSVSPMPMRW